MIRTRAMLLRQVQEFFHGHLVGLYSFDKVKIAPPELREPISDMVAPKDRRRMRAEREGLGKFKEQERLTFGLWEILIYSAAERPPVGELQLRMDGMELVKGALDPVTWQKIGERIRNAHQRKAS